MATPQEHIASNCSNLVTTSVVDSIRTLRGSTDNTCNGPAADRRDSNCAIEAIPPEHDHRNVSTIYQRVSSKRRVSTSSKPDPTHSTGIFESMDNLGKNPRFSCTACARPPRDECRVFDGIMPCLKSVYLVMIG